ncbi:MAG: DNA polymerase III subunit gamma/tau [Candidatus Omnitrophica bacterium]|nr:DNA polymerase III subunit gamma/tau [Candidatus Omnitrophota bacterium]
MSYLVLARKYRPQSFDELQGQEHIIKIFKQAIEANRIAHAFLFCGPRGIGKTSCARILAKSLNCEKGPTLQPCGTCFACQEIAKGNSFDVIEIDGASNRGIDEIRALRENVKFAPSYGRYKIYIVDEVHMLTTEAFNALLKTLEEPPPHVVFIFATTEANKVPATILSRCQRFDFKRISLETISHNLKEISQKEGVKIQDEALFAIAKAAGGSMRDALGILDQLSALGQKGVEASDVFSMLGIVEMEYLFALTDALVDKDCVQAMIVLNQIIDAGKDLKQLGKDVTEHFRHMMIAKIGGAALNNLIDYPKNVKERLASQANRTTVGAILKAIELLIQAQETSRVMETMRMPLEVAFARMTLAPVPSTSLVSTSAPVAAASMAPAAVRAVTPSPVPSSVTSSYKPSIQAPKAVSVVESKEQEKVLSMVAEGTDLTLSYIQQQWHALTHAVSEKKMSLATYMQEAAAVSYNDGNLVIGFAKEHNFAKDSMAGKDNAALVEKIFSQKLGRSIYITIRLLDEAVAKEAQPIVQDAIEMFGGKVINEWHNEVKPPERRNPNA